MPEWELVKLPSFEADLQKYNVDQDKLNKWFEDLQKKPDYINNAHALMATWKPFWSAHFNEKANYIILYLLCTGNEDLCFLSKNLEYFSFLDFEIIKHICDKNSKKIFVCRFGTHKIYKE